MPVSPHWVRDAVTRYQSPLIRYVCRMLGDIEQARDVVQDAFLRLCHQDQVLLEAEVRAWLYAVCRNRAIDILRKERRVVRMDEGDTENQVAAGPSAAEALEENQRRQHLNQAMKELTPPQQEVLRLKFGEGLSYREISRITGFSESNVGFLIHVGVKKLRECVGSGSMVARGESAS